MEYSIEFANRLIEAADSFVEKPSTDDEAGRAVLYLSLLSCEILLKSVLEIAGFTPKELRRRSHNLNELLTDICRCEVQDRATGNHISAAELLSISPISDAPDTTIGTLLDAESEGASKYPNEIRYGDLLKHYSPVHILECAKSVSEWAATNMDSIRKRP